MFPWHIKTFACAEHEPAKLALHGTVLNCMEMYMSTQLNSLSELYCIVFFIACRSNGNVCMSGYALMQRLWVGA